MYNGILICDKPQDFTSHDVVAKLRGILRQRKIGHAGTLDPMATGVLAVLLGAATRASDDAASADKTYIAALRPGVVTDTQDIWGTVLQQRPASPSKTVVEAALAAFRGPRDQLPPMYSAVQIGGRRLYDLARKGVETPRPFRKIYISALELTQPPPEFDSQIQRGDIVFRVTCSKGTYVRTLCHDIGGVLGCGGCLAALRRVQSGGFGIGEALSLARIEELHRTDMLEGCILPTEGVYAHLPQITLNADGAVRVVHGNYLLASHISGGQIPPVGGLCRVHLPGGEFYMTGIGTCGQHGPAVACHKTFAIKE